MLIGISIHMYTCLFDVGVLQVGCMQPETQPETRSETQDGQHDKQPSPNCEQLCDCCNQQNDNWYERLCNDLRMHY